MATLRIQLVTEKSPVSWAIRNITWSQYSHVDTVLPDGTLLGARSDGGVRIRPANYANFTKKDVYELEVTEQQLQDYYAFVRSQIGKAYDYWAIVGILFRHNWRDTHRWFCSELVAGGLEASGIYKFPKNVNWINPDNLTLIFKKAA